MSQAKSMQENVEPGKVRPPGARGRRRSKLDPKVEAELDRRAVQRKSDIHVLYGSNFHRRRTSVSEASGSDSGFKPRLMPKTISESDARRIRIAERTESVGRRRRPKKSPPRKSYPSRIPYNPSVSVPSPLFYRPDDSIIRKNKNSTFTFSRAARFKDEAPKRSPARPSTAGSADEHVPERPRYVLNQRVQSASDDSVQPKRPGRSTSLGFNARPRLNKIPLRKNIAFGSRTKDEYIEMFSKKFPVWQPAPASYNPKPIETKEALAGKFLRSKRNYVKIDAGPGYIYDPQKATDKLSKSVNTQNVFFGKSRRMEDDSLPDDPRQVPVSKIRPPGPGAYSPKVVRPKSPHFSFPRRKREGLPIPEQPSPGPGYLGLPSLRQVDKEPLAISFTRSAFYPEPEPGK